MASCQQDPSDLLVQRGGRWRKELLSPGGWKNTCGFFCPGELQGVMTWSFADPWKLQIIAAISSLTWINAGIKHDTRGNARHEVTKSMRHSKRKWKCCYSVTWPTELLSLVFNWTLPDWMSWIPTIIRQTLFTASLSPQVTVTVILQ